MQGKSGGDPGSFEMGLFAITSILRELSNKTTQTNNILSDISYSNTAIQNFSALNLTILRDSIKLAYKKFNLLSSINDSLLIMREQKPERSNVAETFGKFFEMKTSSGIGALSIQMMSSNKILLDILSTLVIIGQKLSNILSAILRINFDKSPLENKAKIKSNEFTDLADSIEKFRKNVDKKLISNFENFIKVLREFLTLDSDKFVSIGSIMLTFATTMQIVGIQIKGVASGFKKMAFAIGLVAFMLISPLFILAGATLIGIIWGIKKAMGGVSEFAQNWAFASFAKGILILVLTMMLIKNIPFSSIFKLMLLIAGLGLVIKNFVGKGTSSFSITKVGLQSNKSGSRVNSLMGFAFGISILTLALFAFSEIPFLSIMKMVGFIFLLGLALLTFKLGKNTKQQPLFMFGLGMALIVLALSAFDEVPHSILILFLGFIIGLGLILKKYALASNLKGFGLSLALVVLALIVMDEVNLKALVVFLGFLTGLGFIIKTFFSDIKTTGKTMIGLGVSLLLLGYAFRIISNTNFDLTNLLVFLGFLAAVGGLMMLFGLPAIQEILSKGMLTFGIIALILFGTALLFFMMAPLIPIALLGLLGAIAIVAIITSVALILGVIAIFLIPAVAGAALMFTVSLLIFLSVALFNFMAAMMPLALLGVGGLTVFIIALSYSVVNLVKVGFLLLLATGAAIFLVTFSLLILVAFTAFGLIGMWMPFALLTAFGLNTFSVALLTALKSFILAGFFSLLGILPAVFLSTFAILLIITIGIFAGAAVFIEGAVRGVEKLNDFSTALLEGLWGFIKAGFASVPAIISTMLMILFAKEFKKVSDIFAKAFDRLKEIKFGLTKKFINEINILVDGLLEMGKNKLFSVYLTGKSLIPIMNVLEIAANILASISKISISKSQIKTFNDSISNIVGTISEFSLWDLTKSVAKSILLTPILIVGIITANLLHEISKVDLSKSKIEKFSEILVDFIVSIAEAINESSTQLKSTEKGIKSLVQLVGVAGQLVDVIAAYANMNYNVYDVKDGKLVLTGVKKITPTDILNVGKNIGIIIGALLDPLKVMSSNADVWDFNGIKISNPFASRASKKRIERLEQLGNALVPLSQAMEKFSNSKVLENETSLKNFNSGIIGVVDTMSLIFQKMGDWSKSSIKSATSKLQAFSETFVEFIDNTEFKSSTKVLTEFLDSLSDETKWDRIDKNLKTLSENFKSIATSINLIDLEKAVLLNENLKLLSNDESSKNIANLLEKLVNLNEKIVTNTIGANTQTAPTQVTQQESNNSVISQLLTEINNTLEITNNKLGQKLKVVVVNTDNSNKI